MANALFLRNGQNQMIEDEAAADGLSAATEMLI